MFGSLVGSYIGPSSGVHTLLMEAMEQMHTNASSSVAADCQFLTGQCSRTCVFVFVCVSVSVSLCGCVGFAHSLQL